MIVTRGFTSNTIVTRGYGFSGLAERIVVEIFRFKSFLTRSLLLRSRIS